MNSQASHITNGKRGVREWFVEGIIARPWLSLMAGILIVGAFAAGLPKITANFTHTAFFRESDAMLQEFNRFERQFGNDDAVVIVVHSPSGIFDMESATLLQQLTTRMWKVADVIRVDSLANYSWVHAYEDDIEVEPLLPDEEPLTEEILAERRAVALGHETIPDYLVSKDGKTALVYAHIRPGFESPPDTAKIIGETKAVLEELARGDHEFHLTGGPAINFSFQDSSQRDTQTLVPLVLLMAIIFLIVLLRSVGGVLLPLLVIITAIVSALGAAGWLGIELTAVTMTLPNILIAVGIADSVHILSSFYRARRRGLEKVEAIRYTLSKNFIPTILTSLSTAAGFFAFSTSDLKPVLGLGMIAGCGTIVAWFSTYLIMGSLLVWLPSWVKQRGEASELKEATPRVWAYTRFLHKYRWPILGFYGVMAIASVVIATTNKVNSDPYKYFAKSYPLRKAQDFILDHLSGVASYEMSIETGVEDGVKNPEFLRNVEEFQKRMTALPGVAKAISLVDIFKQTNRSLNGDKQSAYVLPDSQELVAQEFFLYTMSLPQGMDVNDRVTVKNDSLRVTMISSISDSATWTATAAKFEELGRELGLNVTVTGKTKLYQSMNRYVTHSFIQSLIIAVIVVSLILVVAFRSFRLGALAMLPNLVPLIFGGALLKLIGHTLDIGTLLVFSVCLGIAVDDTIHILANFRRHRENGLDPAHAVAMTLTHTGPALVVTTMVLVAAFGTLAFATFIPNVFFGIMSASILTVALFADFTFLPAILMARESSTLPEDVPRAKLRSGDA